MKYLLFALVAVSACSQKRQDISGKLTGRSWKTVSMYADGVKMRDQETTFLFTKDSSIWTLSEDIRIAFSYKMVDDKTITLTSPDDKGHSVYLKIDRLTDSDFDFTMTNSGNKVVTEVRTTRF